MVSVMIIIIWSQKLWVFGTGGQSNNIFSVSKLNLGFKRIRGKMRYFAQAGTIIDTNGRNNQIWVDRINLKGMIESVIKCPITLFSHEVVLSLLCYETQWYNRRFYM